MLEQNPFITWCRGHIISVDAVTQTSCQPRLTQILKRTQHGEVFNFSYSTWTCKQSNHAVSIAPATKKKKCSIFHILNTSDKEKLKRRNSQKSEPSITPKSDRRLMIFSSWNLRHWTDVKPPHSERKYEKDPILNRVKHLHVKRALQGGGKILFPSWGGGMK